MRKKILLGGLSIILFGFAGVLFAYFQEQQVEDNDLVVTKTVDAQQVVDQQENDLTNTQGTSQKVISSESVVAQQDGAVDMPPQKIVHFAPDFTLTSLDNKSTYTLRSFAGEKPVIVDFFAAHCPNCRRNLPKLEVLYDRYRDQVEVVLIGIDSRADTERFFANNPTDIPVVMTNNGILIDYNIRLTNTKALINRDGSLLEVVEFRDILEEDFTRLIESS